MFGSDDHVGGSEERVGPCCINAQHALLGLSWKTSCGPFGLPEFGVRIATNKKIDFCSRTATNPVTLQRFDAFRPVELVQTLFKAFRIGGNTQHPLSQWHPCNRMSANFTHTVGHFLVRKYRSQCRAPIDRCIGLIRQAVLIPVLPQGIFAFRRNTFRDRQFGHRPASLLGLIEPGIVKLQKNPLCPTKITDIGSRQFPIPVVTEAEHF